MAKITPFEATQSFIEVEHPQLSPIKPGLHAHWPQTHCPLPVNV